MGLPLNREAFSGRISGAVERMLETKKVTVEATPLPVPVVLALEKYVVHGEHVHKRILAGFLVCDNSERSKVSKQARASRLCNAATDGGLVQSVDQIRASLKQAPMRSSQLNFFARELVLEHQVDPHIVVEFSSRSCKATTLSRVQVCYKIEGSWVGTQRPGTACRWRDVLAGPQRPDATRSGRWRLPRSEDATGTEMHAPPILRDDK